MAETTKTRAAVALLILRVSLAIFLLQWSIEKFIVPEAAIRIGRNFYGVALSGAVVAILGALETLVALALLFGIYRRLSYGLATLIHAVSVVATWRQLLHPYGAGQNRRPGTRRVYPAVYASRVGRLFGGGLARGSMICSIEPMAGCMVQLRDLLDRSGFFDYSQGCVLSMWVLPFAND